MLDIFYFKSFVESNKNWVFQKQQNWVFPKFILPECTTTLACTDKITDIYK